MSKNQKPINHCSVEEKNMISQFKEKLHFQQITENLSNTTFTCTLSKLICWWKKLHAAH